MISLEQIRSLEERVHTAVTRMRTLAAENATLKQRLQNQEERVAEFETLVAAFRRDQEEIEAGIMAALRHLDTLEDTVSEPDFDTTTVEPPDEPQRHETPDEPQQHHEPQVDPENIPLEGSGLPESGDQSDDPWRTAGDESPPQIADVYDPGEETDDHTGPESTVAPPDDSDGESSNGGEEPELDIF
jgi:hypothetical protein